MAIGRKGIGWRDKIPDINKSAREIIRERAPIYRDVDIAQYLTSVGFMCTRDAVSKYRQSMGLRKQATGLAEAGTLIGESPFAKYDSPPIIETDRAIVMPDIQAPYHHHEFMNHVLELCDVLNVKTAIWAGDVLNVHH